MTTWYEAQRNTDQTEGKGMMRTFATFERIEDAVRAVRYEGVMGVGDGEVVEVTLNALTWQDWMDFKKNNDDWYRMTDAGQKRVRVYGYRKNWAGKWGYGYVDNRDAPIHDPDYQTYLSLKKRFEEE